jgi:hypothetical protein
MRHLAQTRRADSWRSSSQTIYESSNAVSAVTSRDSAIEVVEGGLPYA